MRINRVTNEPAYMYTTCVSLRLERTIGARPCLLVVDQKDSARNHNDV